MGGVKVDATGRASLPGLWAAGEVASTGLQGANRLASNSLLEAAACGRMAAEDVAGMEGLPSLAHPLEFVPPSPGGDSEIAAIRDIMDRDVGVVRDTSGLSRAIDRLTQLRRASQGTTAENAAAVALLIAQAAEHRTESRGGHFRADATPSPTTPEHSMSRWADLE
jgi:L-aspartate oxidase